MHRHRALPGGKFCVISVCCHKEWGDPSPLPRGVGLGVARSHSPQFLVDLAEAHGISQESPGWSCLCTWVCLGLLLGERMDQ